MRLRLKIISFLIFLQLVISCNNNEAYQYIVGLSLYLETHQAISVDQVKNTVFYILPLNSCMPCTESNINMLSFIPFKKEIKFLFVGTLDQINPSIIKNICSTNRCIFDNGKIISHYETGLGKPLLIHIKNGRVYKYIYVTDSKIDEVKNYFLLL